METRLGVLEAGLGVLEAGLGVLEARLGVLEARLGVLESGKGVLETSFRVLEARLSVLEAGPDVLEAGPGVLEAGLSVLEARLGVVGRPGSTSWCTPMRFYKVFRVKTGPMGLKAKKYYFFNGIWSWAVPERSGDVPGGSRARIIDFSLVLGGFGGGIQGRAISKGGLSDPLNQDFSRQTKHHWNWAKARAMGLGKDRHKGLG